MSACEYPIDSARTGLTSRVWPKWLTQLGIGVGLFLLVLAILGTSFNPIAALTPLVVASVVCLLVRRRALERWNVGIRWKFVVATSVVAVTALLASMASFLAMGVMHNSIHDMLDESLAGRHASVTRSLEELDEAEHGILFGLTPVLGAAAVVVAAGLGALMAWTVTVPVRRMSDAMRRIAHSDFSGPVVVENNDELGELAGQINEAAKSLARLREVSEAELRGARLIQERLLPQEPPMVEGWQISAYYQPARTVGGDFYDYYRFPDGRVGIVIADAADKGVPAALLMATSRGILRSVAEQFVLPGLVLGKANGLLYPQTPPTMFVTVLYAVLDPTTGRVRYANAGHCAPYTHANGETKELRATGMPLGLFPDIRYDEQESYIAPGSSVILFSDGLVEAHDPGKQMFGFPRLRNMIDRYPGGGSIIPYLIRELHDFTGPGWEQEDDVTLVTLTRSGAP